MEVSKTIPSKAKSQNGILKNVQVAQRGRQEIQREQIKIKNTAALHALLADTMLQFLLGFTFGTVVGMYLAQNCDIPDLAKN